MHDSTKSNLETIASWTKQTVNADSFVRALSAGLPEQDEDSLSSIGIDNSFGSITLNLYEAGSVDEVKPLLLLARECGFTRKDEAEESPYSNMITWRFYAPIEGETEYVKQALVINLHLRTVDGEGAATCGYVTVGKKEVDDIQMLCGEEFAAFQAAKKAAAEADDV